MDKPHIIIDFAHATQSSATSMLRHVINLQTYYKNNATIEVVAYGDGLPILIKNSAIAINEKNFNTNGVSFLACHYTMQSMKIDNENLISMAIVTPSGLGHIIDRQIQGWAYIKE
jgi:intracellular sulfur oxidation DsrE/DsrF family protein